MIDKEAVRAWLKALRKRRAPFDGRISIRDTARLMDTTLALLDELEGAQFDLVNEGAAVARFSARLHEAEARIRSDEALLREAVPWLDSAQFDANLQYALATHGDRRTPEAGRYERERDECRALLASIQERLGEEDA